jgi:hypothetical protein
MKSKFTGTQLTGCYVGSLTYKRKALEENNFDIAAEIDTENAKII